VLRYCGGVGPSKVEKEMSKGQPSDKNKDDGGTPGPTGTLSGSSSGQVALRREQQEQLESNHREN
jgi:hypothetical protein